MLTRPRLYLVPLTKGCSAVRVYKGFLQLRVPSDYSGAANKLKSINLRPSGGYEVGSKCFGKPVPCLGLLNQVKVHSETESLCA